MACSRPAELDRCQPNSAMTRFLWTLFRIRAGCQLCGKDASEISEPLAQKFSIFDINIRNSEFVRCMPKMCTQTGAEVLAHIHNGTNEISTPSVLQRSVRRTDLPHLLSLRGLGLVWRPLRAKRRLTVNLCTYCREPGSLSAGLVWTAESLTNDGSVLKCVALCRSCIRPT